MAVAVAGLVGGGVSHAVAVPASPVGLSRSTPACDPARVADSDIDGDGAPDTVVGVPGVAGVGYVDVYGSHSGHRPFAGTAVPGLHASTRFGSAVSVLGYLDEGDGNYTLDLNGDKCADVLVGDPGAAGGGAVDELFGSPTGVRTDISGQLHARTSGDDFGAAIAVGLHFQNDDDEFPVTGLDVWVGAPGRTVNGHAGAGAVDHYFLSTSDHLSYVESITAGSAAAGSQVQTDAHFGSVLAPVVNSDGGGVLVGTPDQTVSGHAGAGAVTYLASDNQTSRSGIPKVTAGSTATQDTPGVEGTAEAGDHFGASVVYSLYGLFPVVVGVPGEDVGTLTDAGMVNGLQIGSDRYLVADDAGRQFTGGGLTQNSPGIPGTAEAGDQFGAALAQTTGRYTDSSGTYQTRGVTSIGIPGEGVGSAAHAGAVVQVQNKWFSTHLGGTRTITQAFVGASSETDDHFGQALAATEDDNLVIGDPGEDLGTTVDAGEAPVINGAATVNGPVTLTQTLSFPGHPANAHYGAVLPTSPSGSAG